MRSVMVSSGGPPERTWRLTHDDYHFCLTTTDTNALAAKLGYTNFFANVSDYESSIGDSPQSWAVIPAVRHAMASHPYSQYFFHLDAHALVMSPSKSLGSHVLEKQRLESLMLKEVSVVPPDSIIKTFSHVHPEDVDLIITTDNEDMSPGSFVLRQGDFAKFFLDLWFDPLYRSYNFAKAETHVLVRNSIVFSALPCFGSPWAFCRRCVTITILTHVICFAL